MRKLGAAAALAVVLALAGCAGEKTYDSPEALLSAYTSAGGACADPEEVPEDMVGKGAHALLCSEGVTMLLVFDSEEATNRYIAQVSGAEGEMIAGTRWVVVGESVNERSGAMGGRVVTGAS